MILHVISPRARSSIMVCNLYTTGGCAVHCYSNYNNKSLHTWKKGISQLKSKYFGDTPLYWTNCTELLLHYKQRSRFLRKEEFWKVNEIYSNKKNFWIHIHNHWHEHSTKKFSFLVVFIFWNIFLFNKASQYLLTNSNYIPQWLIQFSTWNKRF